MAEVMEPHTFESEMLREPLPPAGEQVGIDRRTDSVVERGIVLPALCSTPCRTSGEPAVPSYASSPTTRLRLEPHHSPSAHATSRPSAHANRRARTSVQNGRGRSRSLRRRTLWRPIGTSLRR